MDDLVDHFDIDINFHNYEDKDYYNGIIKSFKL
jgi:hypothetical protein